MASWKRKAIEAILSPFGIQVAKTGGAWVLIEPEQLRRFIDKFKVDCVFDVGANVGQYATRLRDIGYRGLIISFEPIPSAAAKMRQAAANDPKWIIRESALDSTKRTVTFNIMESDQFSSLHTPDHSATTAFIDINRVTKQLSLETDTLDRVFEELQSKYGFARPFLKMDTQGHDVAVAQGGSACIKKFVGLQSEIYMQPLYEGAPSYDEALRYYTALGFKISAIVPANQGHFPDLNDVDCIMYNPGFWNGQINTSRQVS